MGSPPDLFGLFAYRKDTHFAETGPGSAAQLAGYWEVFSPGPLTAAGAHGLAPGVLYVTE